MEARVCVRDRDRAKWNERTGCKRKEDRNAYVQRKVFV